MYLPNPTIQSILAAITTLELDSNEVVIFLFGEQTVINYTGLIDELNKKEIAFFGAFFPGIIYNDQNFDKGVVLVRYRLGKPIEIIQDLSTLSEQTLFSEDKILDYQEEEQESTIFVLVDGLSPYIADFLADLYNSLGNSVNYIGGGGGSLSLEQKPCLITSEGMLKDAGIICCIDAPVSLGVQHGWKELEGPIIATKTYKNIIYELNWKNAFEVYKSIVDKDSSQSIEADNFFGIAKGYPFGIRMEGQEDIVRDPIAVGEDGELICVGEIESHSVLNILKGQADNLIKSAQIAASESILGARNKPNQIFTVDCISRVLFLEDKFEEELKSITNIIQENTPDLVLTGILSLGEISSDGEGPLYFFNKTIVIGTFN
ncbi:FIST signal transduction protein [Aureispira anguillae]|uniref:FIST C-terminal domain-containing protein n=1 Tax=Aureispira anguillae TaxID=2864201 RepID=A0A915YLQ6_9BACT|nr:FIST C-terminal domain-containing protein [Aureispira anguillae]BDS15539.1 FIST C-terminal domain-containing protein [Aureispira anguillae]